MPNPPPGSLWRVLEHYPKSDTAHRRGKADILFLLGFPEPTWTDRNMNAWNKGSHLRAHDLIMVGETVKTSKGSWVEVLLPQRGWLNRVHFNPDSTWLTRVDPP